MWRGFRIKLRLRSLARRYPRTRRVIRWGMLLSATSGGAYGFINGARSGAVPYDPQAFAIGATFLFTLSCLALAILSMRMRWLRRKMKKIETHNEALTDRNWELKEAEERARSLFESQSDLIVLRDGDGLITSANDAYCGLARKSRDVLI
jgi:PAS domain-containing protein